MKFAEGSGLGTRAFPCHPDIALRPSRHRWLRCPECGTLVRNAPTPPGLYGDDYPIARGHHNPAVARCKIATLDCWLAKLGIAIAGTVVCEIGFGGAACLAALQAANATVYGLEPVAANRAHAQSIGIPNDHIFDVDPLPVLPRKPQLWLFLDSFEHIPDPNALVSWMRDQSARKARVLLVAPDAGSLSRRIMGPLWIHAVPDHFVHYSRRGIASIFGRAGFHIVREFRPIKLISPGIIWRHLRVLAGKPALEADGSDNGFRVWFNVGEMGLLLEHCDNRG